MVFFSRNPTRPSEFFVAINLTYRHPNQVTTIKLIAENNDYRMRKTYLFYFIYTEYVIPSLYA